MSESVDLDSVIDQVASGPAQAGNRTESATAQRIPDLIALDRYRKANAAASNPAGFLHAITVKLVPPGAQ